MKRTALATCLALAAGACAADVGLGPSPVAPATASAGVQAAKPSPPSLVADVVPDKAYESTTLASTCPGAVVSNFSVQFRDTGCLIVQPSGSSYALTDSVALNTTQKRDAITHIQLRGQDVKGPDGIMHETDPIPVGSVTPIATGFTIQVRADRVTVYRLSSHRNGSRVAEIGTVSIGDIVYHAP